MRPLRLSRLTHCFSGECAARMRRHLLRIVRSAASRQSNRHRPVIDQRRRRRPTSAAILSRRSIRRITIHQRLHAQPRGDGRGVGRQCHCFLVARALASTNIMPRRSHIQTELAFHPLA